MFHYNRKIIVDKYVFEIYNYVIDMKGVENMKQNATEDIKKLANQLKTLKELQPAHYYECKGRINALYEKETDKYTS